MKDLSPQNHVDHRRRGPSAPNREPTFPGKQTMTEPRVMASGGKRSGGTNGAYASPGSLWSKAANTIGSQEVGADAGKEDAQQKSKADLLDTAKDLALLTFADIETAGNRAIRAIDKSPEVPKTNQTRQLLGFAASSLLTAVSGPAVSWLIGTSLPAVVASKVGPTVSGLLGNAVKNALVGDHTKPAKSLSDLLDAFVDTFTIQFMAARQAFVSDWDSVKAALSLLSTEQLELINAMRASRDPETFYTEVKHQTFFAWTNFLARAKHGAMATWDHWTDNGSPGAIALPGAQSKPSGRGPDPARSNVAPDNNSPLLENGQRPMQDEAFGVLEVFVYGSSARSMRVVDQPGYRMRLDHVGPKVREEFKTMGRVRELKVNKVIHMCSDFKHGARVDPPTSIAAIMITADGYVRASNWAEFLKVHHEPEKGPSWDPTGFNGCMDEIIWGRETPECHLARQAMRDDISTFASAAQELPLSYLEG